MKDGNQFKPVATHSVGNDEGCVGNNEFAGSENTSRPTHVRLRLEEFNGIEDALCDKRGVLL
jgi:hypothetical protein